MAMTEQQISMAQTIVTWALNGEGLSLEEASRQVSLMSEGELDASAKKYAKAYFAVDANDVDQREDDEDETDSDEE